MRLSKISLIAFVVGASFLQLQAQPASPELQGQALELLRQTISQQRPDPRIRETPRSEPGIAAPVRPAEPAQVWRAPSQQASPGQQQQALDLLRQTLAEVQPPAPPAPSSATARPDRVQAPPRSAQGLGKAPPAPAPRVEPQPPAPLPAPLPAPSEQPAGPLTKQQRLAELLERYRADQLTPSEYHAERARILAEP
jgi:hypothetical protein